MYSFGKVVEVMSYNLLDLTFSQRVRVFLNEKLLKEDPINRIDLEELIPKFIMTFSFYFTEDVLQFYEAKIKEIFDYGIQVLDFSINIYMNYKFLYSYQVVKTILHYIRNGE